MDLGLERPEHLDLDVIRKILEQASDGVMITEAEPFVSPGPRILFVNKAYTEMTGYSAEEVLGQTPRILQGPETDREELARLRGCLNKGVPYIGELINYRKNGERFWTSLHISPIRNGKEVIKFWIGIKRDITRMKQNEERLRKYAEEMEQMVQARTLALMDAHTKLSDQYEQLQSSIDYAKRVQIALLTSQITLKNLFRSSFSFLLPKDKVSGDFIFAIQVGTQKIAAVVDCTGHGVAGAFMSLVGHQMLCRVVIEHHHVSPASILRHLQIELSKLLNQGGEKIHDGMDVTLIRLDTDKGILTYAGANRPLFVAGMDGVLQIPGSKRGIGGFLHSNPDASFTETEVRFNAGDMLYLTSDGYYDQIGGPRNKRMMRKGFESLISEIHLLDEMEQREKLKCHFDQWRNGNEQLDDVAVLGIRM